MGDDPKSKYAEITGTAHGGQVSEPKHVDVVITKPRRN